MNVATTANGPHESTPPYTRTPPHTSTPRIANTPPHVDGLVRPHGGALVDRWASPEARREIAREARGLPSVVLDRAQISDLGLIANGAYSPLEGFMERDDLDSVVHRMRLASGAVWTIPIVLAVDEQTAGRGTPGSRVALRDGEGEILGVLSVRDRYTYDIAELARKVFRTADIEHPGVRRVFEQGSWFLGGPITVLRRPVPAEFPMYDLDPALTRSIIRERGWKTVVGFQTRNPIHRAHEFILKSALELHDALFIHPLVGETRPQDVPAHVRVRCYEVLLDEYYPKGRTLLSVLPAVMRFAGPREAVFHALVRKNYGCTHFIVGRDHAGLNGTYGPYEAQEIFDEFDPEELGVTPLRFEDTFYCGVCRSMASRKTCPHPAERHVTLSGTRVREMLARREMPPTEITRPEVARVLLEMEGEVPHALS